MFSEAERRAMRRARELAVRGPRGPLPQVGAVVLSPTGAVLGEAYRRGASTPHVAVVALASVPGDEARGATLVITLEPCDPDGRTDACVSAITEAGISRLVYSVADPLDTNGRGAEALRTAGIDVAEGLDQEEGAALIADWLLTVRGDRPTSDSATTRGAAAGHRVIRGADATVPTSHGTFRFLAYHDPIAGTEHLAVVSGELGDTALVRVHSECLTGEAFGSQKCECGPQLDAALDAIHANGGLVVYMRGQEGRGIGLLNKLRAYALQEEGLDTLDANLALGLPADARDYAAAAAILADLGVAHVRLMTNNADKVDQLRTSGIDVLEQVPLVVGVGPENEGYLETKRDRMGHVISDGALRAARHRDGAGGRDSDPDQADPGLL